MKSFRELKLIGTPSEQEKLIDLIEQNLCNGWKRARDKEIECRNKNKIDYRIFVCSRTNRLPTASVFLTYDKNGYLYVCNIIPTQEVGKIGRESDNFRVESYNSILAEFLAKLVEPFAQDLDIRIVTTEEERNIDNSMSPELAEKLKSFSNLVNKSSGGTHHYDRERFFDFIIQAELENSLLDESTLKALLNDEGWTEGDAEELSVQYYFAMALLKRFRYLHFLS